MLTQSEQAPVFATTAGPQQRQCRTFVVLPPMLHDLEYPARLRRELVKLILQHIDLPFELIQGGTLQN